MWKLFLWTLWLIGMTCAQCLGLTLSSVIEWPVVLCCVSVGLDMTGEMVAMLLKVLSRMISSGYRLIECRCRVCRLTCEVSVALLVLCSGWVTLLGVSTWTRVRAFSAWLTTSVRSLETSVARKMTIEMLIVTLVMTRTARVCFLCSRCMVRAYLNYMGASL